MPNKKASNRHKASHDRYWSLHGGKPAIKRHFNDPGMKRRLALKNVLDTVWTLGSVSDVAVIKSVRAGDLIRNLAFVIHQSRLSGSLARLKQQNAYSLKLPVKAESEGLRAAFKSLDYKHISCTKVKRCKLYDGHIGDCKGE